MPQRGGALRRHRPVRRDGCEGGCSACSPAADPGGHGCGDRLADRLPVPPNGGVGRRLAVCPGRGGGPAAGRLGNRDRDGQCRRCHRPGGPPVPPPGHPQSGDGRGISPGPAPGRSGAGPGDGEPGCLFLAPPGPGGGRLSGAVDPLSRLGRPPWGRAAGLLPSGGGPAAAANGPGGRPCPPYRPGGGRGARHRRPVEPGGGPDPFPPRHAGRLGGGDGDLCRGPGGGRLGGPLPGPSNHELHGEGYDRTTGLHCQRFVLEVARRLSRLFNQEENLP